MSDAVPPQAHTVHDHELISRNDDNHNSSEVYFPPTSVDVPQPHSFVPQPPVAEVVLHTVFCLEEAIKTQKAVLLTMGYTLPDVLRAHSSTSAESFASS